jgi:hypothetical protein
MLLALAIMAGAIMVGGLPAVLPDFLGNPRNGLIAYASGGDIYVGDAATGGTTAIVAGPEADSMPIFSPDGSLIAFVRGSMWSADASVVVVRPDGSNEQVVVQSGFNERGGIAFAWTPDSASLVINHDSRPFTTPYFDGELSLFDVFGSAEPELLTPPLPIGPGGWYLDAHAPFAQMFRPPHADAILSGGTNTMSLWDADLQGMEELAPAGLDYGLYTVCGSCVAWSPDGTRIAVGIIVGPITGSEAHGSFVMEADGSNVREMPIGAWSPDSSRMAFERCSKDPDRPGAVIVVIDVASGTERVLEATAVDTKEEGVVTRRPLPIPAPPGTDYCGWTSGPGGRSWDYEGWTWTPDGRAIALLERYGMQPMAVDVETGIATDLPWVADSAPSWQPVATD